MIAAFRERLARTKGFALIIVLCFVVLLTVLVVAFFSRAATDREAAAESLDQTKADELARSALNIILGDMKQEMANGFIPPASLANVVPLRSGDSPDIPNLIRRSTRSDSIPLPGISSRASASSSSDPSLNGRFVTASRWNQHFLIPKADFTNEAPDPVATFIPPDWVIVSRNGPAERTAIGNGPNALSNRAPANPDFVIGRYAYAIYDEGGLLDMNVAGYPSPAPAPSPITTGRKGTIAFADLTALPTTASSFVTNTPINRIIGWRNYATVGPSGTFPIFTFTASAGNNFVSYFLDSTRSFLSVSPTIAGAGAASRTDQAFVTRSELIKLRSSINSGAASMLQFLGTFSRERNRPTWSNSASLLAGRWPLGRFDLFSGTLPPSVADAALIKTYFGLVYVPEAPPVAEHWIYTGASSTTRQPDVAEIGTGPNQDPEFFPLLKYVMPTASDSELLSIGASLVDQSDSSMDTTWIEFGDPALPAQKAFGVDSVPPPDPTDPRPASAPVMLKRPFRNVGELGYAYRNAATTLDFQTSGSADAPLLDLFTYDTAPLRAGIVSLNTRSVPVLTAILQGAMVSENASSVVGQSDPASDKSRTARNAAAKMISDGVSGTMAHPISGREGVAQMAAAAANAFGFSGEALKVTSRALAETGQTRTWGLFIDVIAQSGRYAPSSTDLSQFVVGGEKRYWLHVAIDRFTGEVIDQELEAVYE